MSRGRFYNTFSVGEKLISGLDYNLKTRNFYDERLLTQWNYVFGEYAKKIAPCKIIFAGLDKDNLLQKILYISTNDRNLAVEFVFYKDTLLKMLNNYFGCVKSRFTDIKLTLLR